MSSLAGNRGYTGQVSKLRGTGFNQVSVPTMSPEQMQLFQQMFSGASPGIQGGLGQLSQLASGGSPEFWEQMEAPAWRQFGEAQGQLASRFSGMGLGARKSSGFNNAASGMSADLAERLQANRLGLQQNAIRDLLGLGENLLNKNPYDTFLMPKKKSAWQELLGSASGGFGGLLGQFGGLGLLKKMRLF